MKLFKFFYNPFKPHIAQLRSGEFVIRKLNDIGWSYLTSKMSQNDNYWWYGKSYIHEFASFATLEEAKTRLELFKTSNSKPFSKRVV